MYIALLVGTGSDWHGETNLYDGGVEDMATNSNPTQAKAVLDYMKQYGSITPLEALRDLGCMRLGARIYELKHNQGYWIKTEKVSAINRMGKKTHFARYSLMERG